MIDTETLKALLDVHWNLQPSRIEALPSGHTNRTYRVCTDSRPAILRVSWPNKPPEQVQCEEAVLRHLAASSGLPALPRTRPALSAQPCLLDDDGRWLHLFECIPGNPGLPIGFDSDVADAMRALAHLHSAMTTLPANASSPVAWLNARFNRVSARHAPVLPAVLPIIQYGEVLERIGALLAAGAAWIPGPVCWVHGDYHAGNLLFVDGTLSGVIDFDDVGQGSHWLETAFALFALTRDVAFEERFVFNQPQWDEGLRAYASIRFDIDTLRMRERREDLIDLFCADQVLIHLEAAQRGLWTPGSGMGFFACWRRLLTRVPPCLQTP